MKGVMIQGTASDVGKSLIATALCRLFAQEGTKVVPFKSQNMSNNSYVTIDGLEIGRAQGIQAEAAKTEATVWMNPILLKPRSDQEAEVVLLGEAVKTLSGKGYRETFYDKGLEVIDEALNQLGKEFEVFILEGAGSPVEMNLKDRELVNMKIAEVADVPVFLVADIDRGGIFASIVGTLDLLTSEERKRVQGIIINKFRGDFSLFTNGVKWIEEKTGVPVLGVLPYINNHMIDREDSLSINEFRSMKKNGRLEIAVVQLPYASNISDIEPFLYEEDVHLRFVRNSAEFGQPDAVIIPGTKSTIHDLQFIKEVGLAEAIIDFARNGGFVTGICGGYQMLGKTLIDEEGTDTGTVAFEESGLGLMEAVTYFRKEKQTIRVKGIYHPQTSIGEGKVEGYEIHLGDTVFSDEIEKRGLFLFESDREEGYYSENGRIVGTYLHHLFHNDDWRHYWLNTVRKNVNLPQKPKVSVGVLKDERYDRLAEEMGKHLDWEKIKKIISEWNFVHENH
ncbi:cobyric acid synthase [Bacillus sp. V3B]|uniref:cobyric acid synthase n=1 Tax=Bacillus sp. V3B TaxID=2804915 RepID=UPI00210C24A0|nr:cobyric acid synthase [Bacillus sp. V3B]MCQ6276941.1 cobyric acid synthase [Bacillus sp. V3B]